MAVPKELRRDVPSGVDGSPRRAHLRTPPSGDRERRKVPRYVICNVSLATTGSLKNGSKA